MVIIPGKLYKIATQTSSSFSSPRYIVSFSKHFFEPVSERRGQVFLDRIYIDKFANVACALKTMQLPMNVFTGYGYGRACWKMLYVNEIIYVPTVNILEEVKCNQK